MRRLHHQTLGSNSLAGIPELIEDGVSGKLVPPGDENALAEVLSSLLANPEETKRLGVAAQARMQSQFSVEEKLRQLAPLLEKGFLLRG